MVSIIPLMCQDCKENQKCWYTWVKFLTIFLQDIGYRNVAITRQTDFFARSVSCCTFVKCVGSTVKTGRSSVRIGGNLHIMVQKLLRNSLTTCMSSYDAVKVYSFQTSLATHFFYYWNSIDHVLPHRQ